MPNKNLLTIPLLQRIFLFACKKPKQSIELSLVNQQFREVIINFRTASLIWHRNFIYKKNHRYFDSSDLRKFLIKCCRVDSLSWVVALALEDLAHLANFQPVFHLFDVVIPKDFVRFPGKDPLFLTVTSPLIEAICSHSFENMTVIFDFLITTLNIDGPKIRYKYLGKDSIVKISCEERAELIKARSRCFLANRILNSITTVGPKNKYQLFTHKFVTSCCSQVDESITIRTLEVIATKLDEIKTFHRVPFFYQFLSRRHHETGDNILASFIAYPVRRHRKYPGLDAEFPSNVEWGECEKENVTKMRPTIKWLLDECGRRQMLGDIIASRNSSNETLLFKICEYQRVELLKYVIHLFKTVLNSDNDSNSALPMSRLKWLATERSTKYAVGDTRSFYSLATALRHPRYHGGTLLDECTSFERRRARLPFLKHSIECLRLILAELRRSVVPAYVWQILIKRKHHPDAGSDINIFGYVIYLLVYGHARIPIEDAVTLIKILISFCDDGQVFDDMIKKACPNFYKDDFWSYYNRNPRLQLPDEIVKILTDGGANGEVVENCKKWYHETYDQENK